jgi:hypothetical protein
MSSFYDDASWLLIPSGIKEDIVFAQKPTSGLGDLTFTRASDATYTDSTGVVRRSPYNLVQQSEVFSNAAWQKLSASISSNVTTAPNGTLTADTLSVTTTIYSGINQALTQLTGSYTSSIYAKKGTKNWLYIIGVSGSASRVAWFNLNTGVVGTVNAGVTATIQSVGDGWYRCTATDSITGTGYSQIGLADADSSLTPTSSGTAFIWGAQLVQGTSALDYFPTTNRQDVPRIDFRNADGTLSSCGRLLLEPQRTNSIRNSSMVGAVAGSPGTTPTGWISGNAGLTRTIVGIGTENGLPYIDFRYNGTANSTIAFLGYGANTDTAAANGQTWTSAIYAKVIAQPTPPVSYSQNFRLGQSGGSFLSNTTQNFTPTTTLARYAHTVTIANASTLFASSEFYANLTNGATYDFTIRLAAPQMELGSYATTWVPTTTAAVTRIADVASKTGVSSLIGQTEGTLFYEFSVPVNENLTRSIGVTDGTVSNRINISVFATSLFARVDVGGVNQVNSSATIVPTAMNKVAFRYKANDFAAYVNGVKVITDTSGSTFSGTTLSSFSFIQPDGTSAFNGNVGQIAFFKTALTDDQLEVLTSEGYGTYALLAQSLNCVLQ